MQGPGTLRIAFIYRHEQAGHPLARFCAPLPQAPAGAAALPLALPAVAAAALLDVGAKFIESGVTSLVEAAAMQMREHATTLEATVPVSGFYAASGAAALDGATLVLHNGVDEHAANASFTLSLSLIVSPDRTAFRLRVFSWAVDRFLNPQPRLFMQSHERDWLLRVAFVTPGSTVLGTQPAVVELTMPKVTLAMLEGALYTGQDLHWMPVPPAPLAMAGAAAGAGSFLPFNIRATIVETTKPGMFAKWVEQSLTASKTSLASAATSTFRASADPVQKGVDDTKRLEAANTAFASYRKAWDSLKTMSDTRPALAGGQTAPADLRQHSADVLKWETGFALQEKTLAVARASAVVALHNAGIGWAGDLPPIPQTPRM